jgi:hypothetical protein
VRLSKINCVSVLMSRPLTWMCHPDDPRVPVHLLVYAVQVTVTTATCIADYMSWSEFSTAQKMELGKLYVPYLALGKPSLYLPCMANVNGRLMNVC